MGVGLKLCYLIFVLRFYLLNQYWKFRIDFLKFETINILKYY